MKGKRNKKANEAANAASTAANAAGVVVEAEAESQVQVEEEIKEKNLDEYQRKVAELFEFDTEGYVCVWRLLCLLSLSPYHKLTPCPHQYASLCRNKIPRYDAYAPEDGKATWWSLRTKSGRQNQVVQLLEIRSRGSMFLPYEEAWVPTKRIQAWNPKTEKMGNRTLKYGDGDWLLLKAKMTEQLLDLLKKDQNYMGLREKEVFQGVEFPIPCSSAIIDAIKEWEEDKTSLSEEEVRAEKGLQPAVVMDEAYVREILRMEEERKEMRRRGRRSSEDWYSREGDREGGRGERGEGRDRQQGRDRYAPPPQQQQRDRMPSRYSDSVTDYDNEDKGYGGWFDGSSGGGAAAAGLTDFDVATDDVATDDAAAAGLDFSFDDPIEGDDTNGDPTTTLTTTPTPTTTPTTGGGAGWLDDIDNGLEDVWGENLTIDDGDKFTTTTTSMNLRNNRFDAPSPPPTDRREERRGPRGEWGEEREGDRRGATNNHDRRGGDDLSWWDAVDGGTASNETNTAGTAGRYEDDDDYQYEDRRGSGRVENSTNNNDNNNGDEWFGGGGVVVNDDMWGEDYNGGGGGNIANVSPGAKVRVVSGSFADFEGTVVRVEEGGSGNGKVEAELDIFGKMTRVSLSEGQFDVED